MSKLERYDAEKLLDDIKLIAKSLKIIRDENNPENRKFACGLTEDLLNRLYNDLEEMRKIGGAWYLLYSFLFTIWIILDARPASFIISPISFSDFRFSMYWIRI